MPHNNTHTKSLAHTHTHTNGNAAESDFVFGFFWGFFWSTCESLRGDHAKVFPLMETSAAALFFLPADFNYGFAFTERWRAGVRTGPSREAV